jgi:hypothetical protein
MEGQLSQILDTVEVECQKSNYQLFPENFI